VSNEEQQMSYDITPYSGHEVGLRNARRAGRAISRNRAGALVRVSGTDADTDVAQAKIDNLTMATGTAMSSVVRVAQAQRHLEQLAPEASARLAFLADDHMLGMGEVLAELRHDLSRR
jgi:outer membrane scaffolding protein for murein synthesis (MipA/OmpV family)